MMAGNPNWRSLNNMRPLSQQPFTNFLPPATSLFPPQYVPGSSPLPSADHDNQEFPLSWSQLLPGGLAREEERYGNLENWEDQILNPSLRVPDDIKQEIDQSSQLYSHQDDELQACSSSWSSHGIPVSSSRSCVTSLSNSVLDFSSSKADGRNQYTDYSSEINGTVTSGAAKRARVQPSSTQPPLKVRKEKLGDRITALHQLVSPFGKTDTASVLLEAIGYIRFLQGQIEALSSPYLGNVSGGMRHQESVKGERSYLFPEEPGQDIEDRPKDLRNRGLCLVPVSCTRVNVGNDNGADYWAPALSGGF